MRLFAYFWM